MIQMTNVQFHKLFRDHLRIGEPARSSVLAEMQTHLNELDKNADPVQVLGRPKDLAHASNRTHIGFLSSRFRLFFVPWVFSIFVTGFQYLSLGRDLSSVSNLALSIVGMNILLIMFLFLAI